MAGLSLALGLGIASAVGSTASGIIGSKAAKKAGKTQAAAADRSAELQSQSAREALDFQRQMWQTQQQNFAPWLNVGRGALSNLSHLMGIPAQQQGAGTTGVPSGSTTQPQFGFGGGGNVPINQLMQGGENAIDVPFRAFNTDGGTALPDGSVIPMPTAAGGIQAGQNFQSGVGGQPGAGGLDPQINPELGSFGSLMQPFGETFTAPEVTEDPGYQFRLKEGMDALEHSAAARGGLLTGATAEALTDYSQGLASQEYGNAYNRALTEYQQAYNIFQQNQANQFNRLSSLSGGGQTAAGNLSSAGQFAAGNIGNILLGSSGQIGNTIQQGAAARASGYVGSANAATGALQGGVNNIGQMMMLQNLFGQGGNFSGTGFSSPSSIGGLGPIPSWMRG